MNDVVDRIEAPPSSRERLITYGRTQSAWAEVWQPRDVPSLIAALKLARRDKRKVSFRASGHSFHDQALNDDLVISMSRLDRILAIDPEAQTITVQPAVRWGAIVKAALEHDLFPYVVVSTSEATAGGTLSSDGISRHSPSYGSESAHVMRFDLLTPGADAPRTIERPAVEDDDENARIFREVIGGFGYLGAVTSITYRLLSMRSIAPAGAPLRVATRVESVQSFDELINKQLRPACDEAGALGCPLEERPFSTFADEAAAMFYSVAFMRDGNGRGAIYRSWYTRAQPLRPYIVFRPHYWLRVLLGVLATIKWIRRIGFAIAWWYIQRDASEDIVFVNDALDFTFFMDANITEKELAERFGFGLPVIQQTFVVPIRRAAAFLDEVPELMAKHEIMPTLIDVLYMPSDLTLMSASHGREGFACTFSFEDIRTDGPRERVIAALHRLSERCGEHGGRVHLTKNVFARPETLAKMYEEQLPRFLALKKRLDPDCVLQNGFFERVFRAPSHFLDAHENIEARSGGPL